MQFQTLPQDPAPGVKEKHPADGSDRWSVTGEHGKVVYDLLGNHLALIPTYGEMDSVMGLTLKRTREYARLNDDDAVFAVLADVYRAEILSEFLRSSPVIDGEVVEPPLALTSAPVNPDRRCRTCNATSGLILLPGNPLTGLGRAWECVDGCRGGAK